MRVYFVGAHSTGKTTMARYVSRHYGLPLLNEVSRVVLAEMELSIDKLRANLDIVDNSQREIFLRQVSEESAKKDFVSDRSFDNLAYAAEYSSIFSDLIRTDEFKKYVATLSKEDAFIFFIRPNKMTMVNDGVREKVDWEGIVRIDAMVKLMLEMWQIRYFMVSTSNMQERIRLISAVLNMVHPYEIRSEDERV